MTRNPWAGTAFEEEYQTLCAGIARERAAVVRLFGMLEALVNADHCHGHVCAASPDGPCGALRMEEIARAALEELDS